MGLTKFVYVVMYESSEQLVHMENFGQYMRNTYSYSGCSSACSNQTECFQHVKQAHSRTEILETVGCSKKSMASRPVFS